MGAYAIPFTVSDAQGRSSNGNLTLPVTPPNNDCANATPIGEGSFPFDSSGATTDGTASCGFNTGGDIWYLYTPSFTGAANLNTCGSAFDTVVSTHAACGSGSSLCNDDNGGQGPCPFGLTSFLQVPVTSGVPVLIRVARYNGSFGGVGVLNIVPAPPPPATADCTTAQATGEATATFNTSAPPTAARSAAVPST